MKEKKYDYSKIENISGTEYKYAMYAAGAFILINLGFIDVKGNFFNVMSTGLAVFIWWSFRAYFYEVKDFSTAKWINLIIAIFIFTGFTSFLLRGSTHIFDYVGTGVEPLFKFSTYFIGISLLGLIVVCMKIVATNKHHSFHLKRIALSSAIFIPLYILGMLIYNIQLLHQLVDVANHGHKVGGDMFGDGLDFSGAVSGIFSFFSFIWHLFLMIPYYFLFLHFYKADKANRF